MMTPSKHRVLPNGNGKRLRAAAAFIATALLPLTAVAQISITTIVNPSFETGMPGQQVSAGWTQIPGLGPMFIATAGSPGLLPGDPTSAHSGNNFLTANRQVQEPDYPTSQNMGVFQDVDLLPYASAINSGGRQLDLSFAYNDNDPNDTAIVSYNFLDGLGSPIGNTYTFTAGSPGTGAWSTTSLVGEIPAGASSMRLSLQTAFTGGSVRNISYDSFSATILPPAPPAMPTGLVNGNLIQFDGDGAWTWYSDERAIVDPNNGRVLVNSVGFAPSYVNNSQNIGIVDLVNFDPETGRRVRTQLSNLQPGNPNIQRDDHNNGALLVLPDGRYLALYANHGNQGGLGDRWTRWRVSNNPGDSTSWTNEQIFDWFPTPGTDTNVSYHNLFYLSEEDQVYNISRGNGQAPNILRYDMDTNSLAWAGQLADSSTGGYSTGYFKYASNGVDRIYFTHTETHPRDFNTSVYSGYIENGQSFDMLGNVIDTNIFDNESAAGGAGTVPDVTQFTLVQQADALGAGHNRLWTVDTNLDDGGIPMALYISRWNPDGSTSSGSATNPIDHRLHFAHWNSQSNQWETRELAQMGDRLYTPEQDYTGNGALVPGDPNTIYISTQYDPREFDPQNPKTTPDTTFREIYKGATVDGGTTWTWTPITENSSMHNLRPVVPDPHGGPTTVLWFRGTYTTAQSINAAVVGIVERSGEEQGLVDYIDANASNTMYASGAALQTSTPSGSTGALDDLWHQRTGFGNGGSVLTSSEAGFENAPMLKTTIGDLEDGLYDVFAYFWSDDDEDWRLMAGLESNNLIDFRRYGSQHAEADQFAAIETVSADSNDLLLYRAYLGRTEVVGGADFEVFIDDWQSLVGGAIRTWYDGVGFSLVTPIIPPLAGDFNGDNIVDAADYVVWREGLGTIYTQDDYDDWVANFGASAGSGSNTSGNATIPEPASVALVVLSVMITTGGRRKRRSSISSPSKKEPCA